MPRLDANATRDREDISRFVVHLTRDDRKTFTNGASPRANFLAIIKSREIYSIRPHCLFNVQVKKLPKEVRDKFNVACLTETPLNQLHLLVGAIPGRQIELEPFGFVFTKEFIAAKGGQPAIYVNSYNQKVWLRESTDALFQTACVDGKLTPKLWRLLPFINAMHERYDFSWEREWRVRNGLKFALADLVCVILPSEGEDDLKEKFAKSGIAVISPGWAYEQIVTELARQQRKTKSLTSITAGASTPPTKNERPNAA